MPSDAEDLRLLKDCLEGQPVAWEAFVRRFAPYLAEVCRHALARYGLPAGPPEVEDMLQEVFLVFLAHDHRALRAHRGAAPLASYLASLAIHRVAKERRPTPPGPPVVKQASEAPGAALEALDESRRLRAELQRLPPMMRLAVVLHGEDRGLREIGQALGISKDAAAELLARAKGLLRERL